MSDSALVSPVSPRGPDAYRYNGLHVHDRLLSFSSVKLVELMS